MRLFDTDTDRVSLRCAHFHKRTHTHTCISTTQNNLKYPENVCQKKEELYSPLQLHWYVHTCIGVRGMSNK